jgi:hypothetical protein
MAHVTNVAAPVDLGTVPLAEAKRRLKQSFDAGDIVRPSTHPDYLLVSSKSRPGFFHATSLTHCDCEAHARYGLCRHRIRVSWERHQARKQAQSRVEEYG